MAPRGISRKNGKSKAKRKTAVWAERAWHRRRRRENRCKRPQAVAAAQLCLARASGVCGIVAASSRYRQRAAREDRAGRRGGGNGGGGGRIERKIAHQRINSSQYLSNRRRRRAAEKKKRNL